MLRVARFLDSYLRCGDRHIRGVEVPLAIAGREVSASLLAPAAGPPRPGWIVLHGITVPGRHHPALRRFAQALSHSGAVVLIPDIPAWRDLRIDPAAADAAIAAAVRLLRDHPAVADTPLTLVGFSFGATQALISASRPELRSSIRSVVGFGGYCDLRRTFHFMMTGEHEWKGVTRRSEPDPYGRWIVAGNYLTNIPEYAGMGELAGAAHELAKEAGRRGAYAAEREYDPFKLELRKRLPLDQQELWDLIAPPAGMQPAYRPAADFAARLVEAALSRDPSLDATVGIAGVDQRVVLAHGYDDRLIPFSETLRLREALPQTARTSVYITRLFAHSREAESLAYWSYPREIRRYFALLRSALQPC